MLGRAAILFAACLSRAAFKLFGSSPAFASQYAIRFIVNAAPMQSVSTPMNIMRGNSEVSEQRSKETELSSVAEMSSLVREVADHAAPSPNWKDRVHAAARVLKLPFNRVKAHYYGEARRVDAEEMDRARAAAEELREARLRRQAGEHLRWLNASIQHLRQTDEEFHSFDVDGLERAVARLGAQCGALGDTGTEGGD